MPALDRPPTTTGRARSAASPALRHTVLPPTRLGAPDAADEPVWKAKTASDAADEAVWQAKTASDAADEPVRPAKTASDAADEPVWQAKTASDAADEPVWQAKTAGEAGSGGRPGEAGSRPPTGRRQHGLLPCALLTRRNYSLRLQNTVVADAEA